MDGIDEYIPPMISFLSKHVDKNSKTGQADIRINEVRDIEETVWSPRLVCNKTLQLQYQSSTQDQAEWNPFSLLKLI